MSSGTWQGAWDASPLNRIEVTVTESQNVTSCTGIDLYSNKYSCQVVLDKERGTLHPLTALK